MMVGHPVAIEISSPVITPLFCTNCHIWNWCIKGVKFRVYSRKSGPVGTLRFLAGEVLTRVLDPTFALVTRRVDIDRAQTRIVSCVSDGQVRCRPRYWPRFRTT
jgi:hypothetical protein